MIPDHLLRRTLWWLRYVAPRHDVTVETFNGRLTFSSRQWLIGKYLYVMRGHEANEIRSAMALVRRLGYCAPSDRLRTVINAGANIGMTTIALIKEGYVDRALAFEPAPENFKYLVRNIAANGLEHAVRTFQMALSRRDGEVKFELSPDNSGDHRVRVVTSPGFYREETRKIIRVRAASLDSLMRDESFGAREADLLWVDIQGHEGYFFQGAREFLRRDIPTITEFWPYGIGRSGISEHAFVDILSQTFNWFYLATEPDCARRPIGEVAGLFAKYSSPRQFCTLLLTK